MDKVQVLDEFRLVLSQVEGYSEIDADSVATHVTSIAMIGARAASAPNATPSPAAQACYDLCKQEKMAALEGAALAGFPAGWILAAKAVLDFNACRASCDRAG